MQTFLGHLEQFKGFKISNEICSFWRFWSIFGYFSKKTKKGQFQAFLQPKGMVVGEKCPGLKSCKMIGTFEWNRIHAKKIIFGYFRAINVTYIKFIFFSFLIKIWIFWKNRNFQSLLQPKGMVVGKKCPRPKSCKMSWTFEWNRIHAKKIIFGYFRAINVTYIKFIFFYFLKKKMFFFKLRIYKRLKKIFFEKF